MSASASPRQTLAQKNPDNVIRGLKAAIHNPNVSEAGKQHAVEQLNEMGVSVDDETKSSAPLGRHSVITTRTMVHESVTQSTEYAPGVLERGVPEADVDLSVKSGDEDTSPRELEDKKAENRVMGGYKAALRNPHVSREAKEHALQVLKEHGAEY